MIMDETMDVSTIHEIPRIEIVFCPDCDTDNEQEAVLCEHHQGMMEGWNSGWDEATRPSNVNSTSWQTSLSVASTKDGSHLGRSACRPDAAQGRTQVGGGHP